MDKKAFESTLRSYAKRTPFRPFTVELVSGSKVVVRHPEALITDGVVAAYLGPDHEITVFDYEGVTSFTTGPLKAVKAG